MKKIAVIPNPLKDIGLIYTREVIDALAGGAEIVMEDQYRVSNFPVHYRQGADIYKDIDIAILLGGDGTIIQSAGSCARNGISMLGINLGTIGFMSEVETVHIKTAVRRLLADDYRVENRMMLKVDIIKNGNHHGRYHALNDVIVSKSPDSKLIDLALYSGEERVNTYVADGIIIATPTGSTGYSLSAGGPVVDPMMQLYVATPICAHMLSARSAVLPAEKSITIRLNDRSSSHNEAMVSVDGDMQCRIKNGDEVVISKSQYDARLIRMIDQSFYDTLIQKLS